MVLLWAHFKNSRIIIPHLQTSRKKKNKTKQEFAQFSSINKWQKPAFQSHSVWIQIYDSPKVCFILGKDILYHLKNVKSWSYFCLVFFHVVGSVDFTERGSTSISQWLQLMHIDTGSLKGSVRNTLTSCTKLWRKQHSSCGFAEQSPWNQPFTRRSLTTEWVI